MSDEPHHERRSTLGWRIKREISTGDLLLAISIISGLFLWGNGIDKRLTAVEERQVLMRQNQQHVDSVQDQAMRDQMALIMGELRDIKQYLLQSRK